MSQTTTAPAGNAAKPGRQLIQGENVCNCFGITEERLEEIFEETKGAGFETIKQYYQIGSRCSSCEIEVKDLLGEYHERCRRRGAAVGKGRIPLLRRFHTIAEYFRQEVRYWVRSRRFGIFVVRSAEVESSLVLSNMAFPEDQENANGPESTFHLSLYDAAGKLMGRRLGLKIRSGQSLEMGFAEMFPEVKGDFAGILYVDFAHLREKGSLRPYCCFLHNKVDGKFIGRWHYHDQYFTHPKSGCWHNTHPFQPGKTCWLALANPLEVPFQTKAFLRWKGKIIERELNLPPNGTLWKTVNDFFGVSPAEGENDPEAMFWLDNPAALMVWFFWHKHDGHIWTAQHH